MLRLYNTLTRKKEDFRPLDPAKVRMYVCGPTVYDFAHIGNARPVIVFDVLYRLLRHLYGPEHVTYVRNITDVDDKINARAAQDYPGLPLNEAIRRVTEKTEAQFHADMAALGALPPSVEPRATEHIEEMKAMIETLVANGCAYVAEDHVLFHVAAMKDYGKLSGRSLDEMIAGARVEVAPYKKDPMDFVLWKPSKPGEPSWQSPARIKTPGRPGWHIECSAMAKANLGDVFDIHGGGIDLVFPHHENEIAQSRCANRTPIMAQVWMHNGFLQVEGEKMAKSAGNFVTVHELLQDWPGEVIRMNMLRTHYRQPIDWTVSGLNESESTIRKWSTTFLGSDWLSSQLKSAPNASGRFWDALYDDLNTPLAITELHKLYDWARRFRDDHDHNAVPRFFQALSLLGLDQPMLHSDRRPPIGQIVASAGDNLGSSQTFPSKYVSPGVTGRDLTSVILRINLATIDGLIDTRNAARAAKDFKEADRIRKELEAMGIVLKDAKDPNTGELTTTWEVAR